MNTQHHIMIDIETLSTQPNAAIVSIGAVAFTMESGISRQLFTKINLDDAINTGGHVSGSAIEWWSKQPYEARHQLVGGNETVREAITRLYGFIPSQEDVQIWANSPSFDLTIIRESTKRVLSDAPNPPWQYWQENDYRTYIKAASSLGFECSYRLADVTHNALDDARNQANQLIKAYHYLHDIKGKADDRDLMTLSVKGGEA